MVSVVLLAQMLSLMPGGFRDGTKESSLVVPVQKIIREIMRKSLLWVKEHYDR